MPSRSELVARANALNITVANYPNDSKLEQAVIYAQNNLTTASNASTVATAAATAAQNAGGANI